MDEITTYQSPKNLGPLALHVTRRNGRAVHVSVSIAGRTWPMARLEPVEREWVHAKLDELGIARRGETK